jgi:S-adenosylmethionine/arginine decarboxylase-like enzyme
MKQNGVLLLTLLACTFSALVYLRGNENKLSPQVHMANSYLPNGTHFIMDFYGIEYEKLRLLEKQATLDGVAVFIRGAKMTLLGSKSHVFEGGGVTAVFLLSESHISLHT